jgi:hypothetical protein
MKPRTRSLKCGLWACTWDGYIGLGLTLPDAYFSLEQTVRYYCKSLPVGVA